MAIDVNRQPTTQDIYGEDRLIVLVEVLSEFVVAITKGSMYAAMVKPAMKYFSRKVVELPPDERQNYLEAVYQFSDIARNADLSGDEYRQRLVGYLVGLVKRQDGIVNG